MLETFLTLHWAWYIPMYLATGVILTGTFLTLLSDGSNLYDNIVRLDNPPPVIIAMLWPLSILAGILMMSWEGMDILFIKAARLDPVKLSPSHYIRNFKRKKKAKNQTEADVVGESVPSWARWH